MGLPAQVVDMLLLNQKIYFRNVLKFILKFLIGSTDHIALNCHIALIISEHVAMPYDLICPDSDELNNCAVKQLKHVSVHYDLI